MNNLTSVFSKLFSDTKKPVDKAAEAASSTDSASTSGRSASPASSSEAISEHVTPTLFEKWSSFEIEPGVRCSSLSPTGELISVPINAPNVRTSWDAFQHGLAISPKGNCLGWRSKEGYDWWTYEDVSEHVRKICAALKVKTALERQQFVGIYACSVPLWTVAALAINARSLCVVPIYDTLGPDSRSYIINQAEMTIIFVDKPEAVGRILDSAKETPSLKTVVCFCENLCQDILQKASENSISVVTLNDFVSGVEQVGEDVVFDVPKREDIAVVQYTSGTTGYPKGVVITHEAYIANMVGIDYPFEVKYHPVFDISETAVCLLFLPLAHMYAQIVTTWFFFHGASIGFYGGNVMKVVEDAAILRPTFIPLVPRIMNRVYNKVKTEIAQNAIKSKLFWYCYNRKKEMLNRCEITRNSVWDFIAFRKIQNLLGGNVRYFSVGSAPVSAEVLEFWRVCFGAAAIEGYGQSECAVIATMALGPVGGNVGHPLVCNYVKLADVEECGYFAKDGKGEVCIKGPNVMTGYYKQPDKTAEAIDADGWLHTGDIGDFLPDGSLRIFDRKKHIFKLAQGEYIAPEKVENIYMMCPLVSQIFVDGSSLESFTVAIVVPDPQHADAWAKSKNVANPEANPDFVKYVLDEMVKVGKEHRLNSLEQVKNVYLTSEAFSPVNGQLTPSLKNKRPQLRRAFKEQIEAMYKAGPITGEAIKQ